MKNIRIGWICSFLGLLLLTSCDDIFKEYCIYKGLIQTSVSIDKEYEDLDTPAFRVVYYPVDGLGAGILDGSYDVFEKSRKSLRELHIGHYKLLTYNPGNCHVRDSAFYEKTAIVCDFMQVAGENVITQEPGLVFKGTSEILVQTDDTCRVNVENAPIVKQLKLKVYLDKVPMASFFQVKAGKLTGLALGKKLYNASLLEDEGNYSFLFTRSKNTQNLFEASFYLFGVKEGAQNSLSILLHMNGMEKEEIIGLDEKLENWVSFYREVSLHMKVGEDMNIQNITIDSWIDKDFGDIPLLE